MPNFLAAVGESNLGQAINTGLNTMVNLRKMENDAAATREEMAIRREDLGMRRETHEQNLAISRETLAAKRMENEAAAKEQAYLDERIPIDDAFGGFKGALMPDDYDKFKGMIGKSSEDGTTISRRNQQRLLDDLRKDPTRIQQLEAGINRRSAFDLQKANDERMKAKKEYEKKGDEESHKKWKDAEGKYVETAARIGKTTEAVSHTKLSMSVMNMYEDMEKDPETKKLMEQNPLLAAAFEAGDFKAAHQEMTNIRTERAKAEALAAKPKTVEQLTWDAKNAPTPEARKAAQDTLDSMERREIRIGKGKKGDEGIPGSILSIPPAAPGERNDAALKGVSSEDAAIVKQLAEYKIPLPSGFALRSPMWKRLLALTVQYDPTFDAKQYNARAKILNDFTSGKSAFNVRSLNTAIAHLDTLKKKATELNNSSIPLWNEIANRGITAVGDKRVVGFNNAATAVESELAAVFKGMGATDQEIKAWRTNLNAAGSPAQIQEGINTGLELMKGRLHALASQYEKGMGKPANFSLLSKQSRGILTKLGVDLKDFDPGAMNAGEGGAPAGNSPPKATWLSEAKKSNPGASDKELSDYYDNKYGGR